MMPKETARQKIAELVEQYRSQSETYESAHYDEANTRRDFLDDLFTALGWDIGNKKGLAESYREVILEDNVIVDGNSKAADYAFRIGKTVLFYVEAKKPSVNIKNNQEAAFQLRRYGWSKKEVSISILTNFKEFAVYDCTKQPNVKDKPHVARLTYLTFEDFGETKTFGDTRDGFDFLWDTFEYNNVLRGSLEKYLKDNGNKQGVVTVDEAFLQLLEDWREVLAKSVCRTNQGINEEDLNFVVHEILNRIVFLRMMESRKIETFGNLQRTVESNQCYKKLITLFQRADEKYNSGLFNFDRDKVSEKLAVEDTVLKTMINALYYPCPYNFSQIPVEILGSVYEQFLGKTIRLTSSGKNVKVEEKPEVRKAGGVYYTPQYIVDYIVENTVGKLLEGKVPKAAEKIKVVDPACGSGSFLLGAYQFLLDWHKDYYFANDYDNGKVKSKGLKTDKLTPDYQLTATEKKKILLNNIFGVDIDIVAVEVAKLSLLIKCVEGETEASIENTLWLFHEKVLPDIDSNIRDGNSLIDTDFYDNNFDFGDERKIKPFNWKRAFPAVFKQGGFDVVIGNPPYRTLQLGKKQKSQEQNILEYYQSHYPAAFEYKINLFALFIEHNYALLRNGGYSSLIVPNTFYNTISFKSIRQFLLYHGSFTSIMNLRYKVFKDSEIGGSGIFVFVKQIQNKRSKIITVETIEQFNNPKAKIIPSKSFLNDTNCNLIQEAGIKMLANKISMQKGIVELGSITKIYQGIITGDNQKYLADKKAGAKWKPIIKGRDINRYTLNFNNTFVYYSPQDLWSNTNEKMFNVKEKIISRQTSDKLIATLDREGYFTLDSTHVIHLLTDKIRIEYLLGLYNSKLLNCLYQSHVQEEGRVFAQVKTVNLKPLPIKLIDFNTKEKETHDTVVRLVDQLLQLNAEREKAKFSLKLKQFEEKIAYCEDKINELVYQLYGLSDEEIKIVEGK